MYRSVLFEVLLISIISSFKVADAQITFSEIMYDVATDEFHDEFIELFNCSDFDSIDISGFQFSDSSGVDHILSVRGGLKITPRSFAVLLDGSYMENSTTYNAAIPDSVIILTISDNSFGKSGLSNSKSEYLTIRDSMGNIVSAYLYSIGNLPGRSDEKINLDGTNDSGNWADSKKQGGTPGGLNSVTPLSHDFGFDDNSLVLPKKIYAEEPVMISIQINQYGTTALLDSMELFVFSDLNNDTIFQDGDRLIGREKLFTTAQVIDFEWRDIFTGINVLVIEIRSDMDQNSENDILVRSIDALSCARTLTINEIKFLTAPDEPEWLELYNLGEENVYLKGWSIADKRDTIVIDSSVYIPPSDYMVISKKDLPEKYQLSKDHLVILKKFITFNDQSDDICLLTPGSEVIERIPYTSDWLEGETFRSPSLEKINPILTSNLAENWGPSVGILDGTPGYRNSIFSALSQISGEIKAKPDPFSPDGDGIDDVTLISGNIPETSGRFRVMVFDIKGRKIRSLRENRYTGSQFSIVWDGNDDLGNRARIGIYIIYVQVLNDRRGTSHELKTTVVLAQKL